MSTGALVLPAVRAEAASEARPVCFFVDRRVNLASLRWWRRWGYELFVRRLPDLLRAHPAAPKYRGVLMTFAEADGRCTSADDQLHVLPFGWTFGGDTVEPDTVCRPRDPADRSRYLALRERYGDEARYAEMARRGEAAGELLNAAEGARRAIDASYE